MAAGDRVHKLLDQLVDEMVDKGIHYEDAQREFEKRFITQVVDKCDGNLSKAADTLGVHRNTLARKIKDLKIKSRALTTPRPDRWNSIEDCRSSWPARHIGRRVDDPMFGPQYD